jgi:hypothetical protein
MPTLETMDGRPITFDQARWDRVDQMQVTAAVLGDTVLPLRGVLT